MHTTFAEQRVNKVNTRREFFHVTPSQARAALVELAGDLLTFVGEPAAEEFPLSTPAAEPVTS